MFTYYTVPTGMLKTNCYVLVAENSTDAVLIDPGDGYKVLTSFLAQKGLKAKCILLTHCHVDHSLSCEAFKADGVEVYAGINEQRLLKDPSLNGSDLFRIKYSTSADRLVSDGEIISVCGIELKVIETPGHTEGGVCYYSEEAETVFSGDTLFEGSVGRTDLPTGSMSALNNSVVNKLFLLPDNTEVLPGHGGKTAIGPEKEYNPFVSV